MSSLCRVPHLRDPHCILERTNVSLWRARQRVMRRELMKSLMLHILLNCVERRLRYIKTMKTMCKRSFN